MVRKSVHICPNCGTTALHGQAFCGKCGRQLTACAFCDATNLAGSDHCHNCGKQLTPPIMTGRPVVSVGDIPRADKLAPSVSSRISEHLGRNIDADVFKYLEEHRGEISITRTANDLGVTLEQLVEALSRLQSKGVIQKDAPTFVERMRRCDSCKKTIGADEPFCSYCGAKQMIVAAQEPRASLDPHTMRVALTMLDRIKEAKAHPEEYSIIDEDSTKIAEVALGKEKPYDANELSFRDQLRLLSLVFEYTRDRVSYKGEAFGEYVRWAWETVKTGGDCDCKVVLLATMLCSLAFRRMHLLILPPGKLVDTKGGGERTMQGHVMLEVELSEGAKFVRLNLDPSCPDCDVDEIPETVQPFLQNFYRLPIVC